MKTKDPELAILEDDDDSDKLKFFWRITSGSDICIGPISAKAAARLGRVSGPVTYAQALKRARELVAIGERVMPNPKCDPTTWARNNQKGVTN